MKYSRKVNPSLITKRLFRDRPQLGKLYMRSNQTTGVSAG
jgi:hypothetical protein